jgi:hypothetical protein
VGSNLLLLQSATTAWINGRGNVRPLPPNPRPRLIEIHADLRTPRWYVYLHMVILFMKDDLARQTRRRVKSHVRGEALQLDLCSWNLNVEDLMKN